MEADTASSSSPPAPGPTPLASHDPPQDVAVLYRIATLTGRTDDPRLAGQSILRELMALFRADSGSLALLNPDSGLLETEAAQQPGGSPGCDPFALRLGQGVTGWVALHARPLLVPDVSIEPRYIAAHPGVRCEMAVPLLAGEGSALGVIDLEANRPRAFTADDLNRMTCLVDEASHVLRRLWEWRHSREKSAQLQTLVDLGHSLVTRLEENDLLATLTRSGRALFNARLCTIHLHAPAQRTVRLAAFAAENSQPPEAMPILDQPVPLDDALLAPVVHFQRVMEFQNLDGPAYNDASDLPHDHSICSLLAAPILIDGASSGVLAVFTSGHHRFNNDERRLLAALASIASVALQNARLYARVFQSEETLCKNETLTTLGLLAAELAHEIRNPLTVVKLLHGTLGADFPESDPRRRDLQIITEKLGQLEVIVSRVLSFAKAPAVLRSHWPLDEIIGDTLLLVRAKLAQSGVRLHCPSPGAQLVVDVNKGQLQQVLLNVLLNAVQAMPQGGDLTLGWTATGGEDAGGVQIDISDTGGGIPASIRDHIFESFLSGSTGGTGLGLSIAKRIMHAHHGDIVLAATGQTGTTMRLTLPLVKN
ncbi:MAG: GAF domain-containing protein [Opitutaceae bacterium]|nr:GAF domain-containing protein [Opitutaceae bacterium]